MSEKEKKRRDVYRKNREKWIFAQTIIIVLISLAVLVSTIVSIQLKSKYYVSYRESGSINYNVFLKDNDFFEEEYIGKDQSYVASLIDKIIADFRYNIDMDTDDVNYRYSYTIKSRLEIIDTTSNVAIFNPEQELVSVQNKTQNSSRRLEIDETVLIKYDEYNDLANNFLDTYSLTSTKSNIVVTLEVDVLSSCDAFAGSAADTYTSELRIPLTTKTVNIKMTSAVPGDQSSMIACVRGADSEIFKTTAIVLGSVDVLWILLLVAFVSLTKTPDVTYAARVKKIIGQYKSYIQKINNLFETHGYQIILVDTFDEMLEIRDTIQAPILMHENEDKTCTKFIIPTDSKLLYIYEIKVEGLPSTTVEQKPAVAKRVTVKPHYTVPKVVVTTPTPKKEQPKIKTVVKEIKPVVEPLVIETPEEVEEIPVKPLEIEVPEEIEDAPVELLEIETPEEIEDAPVELMEIETPEEVEDAPVELMEIETPEEVEDIPVELFEAQAPIETEDEVIPVDLFSVEAPIDPTIEEVLDSIPFADEEVADDNMVEAIDVVWEERKDKAYRYDPDGNTVEEGDIVLVPTRDVHSDKEVVREAEVSRGNYKIDPETLDHPLKKIIGVVRRKAEKVFTAMITPDDEN